MSDKNDKLNQLDDVAAYEAELEAEAEFEKEEKGYKPAQPRYPEKAQAKQEKVKKKGKKEFFLKRFGRWLGRKTRDLISELKKVTWPSFPKVMKQTGIVLGVVIFFLIVIFAIDLGLSQLYQQLITLITNT